MSKSSNLLSDGATAVIIVCAVIVTGLTVKRELEPPGNSRVPVLVDDWESLASAGHRRGSADAAVTILEFVDFQCPACRQFATRSVEPVLATYQEDVALVVRHWPLDYHTYAKPAAVAAECAAQQNLFFPMYDEIFAKQDSLGSKSFVDFAKDIGIPDLDLFEDCVDQGEIFEALFNSDATAAQAAGGTGTPTVIINGMLLPGTPTAEELDEHIRNALAERRLR